MRIQRAAGYIGFLSLFGAEVALSALHPAAVEPYQVALLGLAAYQGGRALSYNGVFQWLRDPFCRVEPDSSGAGDSVLPKEDNDFIYAVGDCLACPICTGTHVAGLLYVLLCWAPTVGATLLSVLGAAGIAQVLHWWSERDEWQGRHAREDAGWISKH